MSNPNLERHPLGFRRPWKDYRVVVEVTNINERGWQGELTAEVNITTTAQGIFPLLFFGRMSLLSVNAKATLIREIKQKYEAPPWADLIEATFFEVIQEYRQGEPVRTVGNAPMREGQAYRLKPLLPEGVITNLFGKGGSGKSYLALVIALLVQSGKPMLGLEPEQGHVLYLDYEADAPTVNERVRALKVGLDLPPDLQLSYRRCEMPFTKELDRIIELVSQYHTKLLIIDSVGMSVQGSAIADDIITDYLRAIRSVGCTALLLDHPAKNTPDETTPFGSTYKGNEARSCWSLAGEFHNETCSLSVGLQHTKVNDGRKFPPQGFEFFFENNQDNRPVKVSVSRQDAAIHFFDRLPNRERILKVLADSGKLSSKEIASETSIKPADVSSYLSRLKRAGQVGFYDGKWGLASNKKDEDIPF